MTFHLSLTAKAAGLLTALVAGGLALRLAVKPPPRAPTGDFLIVVRTAPNLLGGEPPAQVAERFARRGVDHVLLQWKQDEDDEFPSGSALYPSALAPVAPGFESDPVGALAAALHARGIAVSAWVPALRDRAAWDAHPDWRAAVAAADGGSAEQPGWLCPRAVDAVDYQAGILAEIAARCPEIDSIYTDFIRYDDDFSCACSRCLAELDRRTGFSATRGRALAPADVRAAAAADAPLWEAWIDLRAESIAACTERFRAALDSVREDLWFGACVLPFSAADYELNTQSGQHYGRLAGAGLDELLLMAYWDDWGKCPEWVGESLAAARAAAAGAADVGVLLDGDMNERRTRATLAAVDLESFDAGYFHYGAWSEAVFDVLERARAGVAAGTAGPRPEYTAVAVRVDTEPDDEHRYDTVRPEMIRELLDLFEAEGTRGTFITCATLVPSSAGVLRDALARGHELGVHGDDHEQIDALPLAEQAAVVDRSLAAFAAEDLPFVGFGAPRNSITPAAYDRLIEAGIELDGSAAYDPLGDWLEPRFVPHSSGSGRIFVVPFVIPNDWDARVARGLDAVAMLREWRARLEVVVARGEPVFVLDVHQWLATRPDNAAALRAFLRAVRADGRCRLVPFSAAARHARAWLEQEGGAP